MYILMKDISMTTGNMSKYVTDVANDWTGVKMLRLIDMINGDYPGNTNRDQYIIMFNFKKLIVKDI